MVKYPETNILIKPLDDKSRKRLGELQTYLEIKGDFYSHASTGIDRLCNREYHYFMGTSVVRITTLKDKADIKIKSLGEPYLSNIKRDIEERLK